MFKPSLSAVHRRVVVGALAAVAALAGPGAAGAMADHGALFTQTNDPAGNVVQKFDRSRDGRLTPAGTFATGGVGLAGLGGRQGAVTVSDDGDIVYATNAGSNTVSAFRVRTGRDEDGLELVGTFASGGAAQASVTPDGRRIVVSERLSNRLETLKLDWRGRPGRPMITASSGTTPFGFGFGRRGEVIVSEAGSSSVSSYRVGAFGLLNPVTSALAVGGELTEIISVPAAAGITGAATS